MWPIYLLQPGIVATYALSIRDFTYKYKKKYALYRATGMFHSVYLCF